MSARLRKSWKKSLEIAAVIGVYILFVAIGVYSGQTTMKVEVINPPDGVQLRSSPVELIVRVTLRGVPTANVTARFTVYAWAKGQSIIDKTTDADGIARLLVPVQSGNFTWQVAAIKTGYPTIMSRLGGFSIRLSLVVDALSPSTFILAIPPVEFKARVTNADGRPVESANVTFYVDSATVSSSLTGINGIAAIKATVDSGAHFWFASATKAGEGGVSEVTRFLVALGSLTTGDLELTLASCPGGWEQVGIAIGLVDLGCCGRAATGHSVHSLRIDRGQNEELQRPQRVA